MTCSGCGVVMRETYEEVALRHLVPVPRDWHYELGRELCNGCNAAMQRVATQYFRSGVSEDEVVNFIKGAKR